MVGSHLEISPRNQFTLQLYVGLRRCARMMRAAAAVCTARSNMCKVAGNAAMHQPCASCLHKQAFFEYHDRHHIICVCSIDTIEQSSSPQSSGVFDLVSWSFRSGVNSLRRIDSIINYFNVDIYERKSYPITAKTVPCLIVLSR